MNAAMALHARASATSALSPYEYCSGKDSICSAFDDLDRDCQDQNGADYYECICVTGWVPTNRACGYCMFVTGQTDWIEVQNYSKVCSEEGFTVAPMPSSIVSEQAARNKTVEVPEPDPTTAPPTTVTFDMPRKTGSHEPETITFYGTPTADLPDIRPSESNDGSRRNSGLRGFLIFSMAFSLSVAVCG